MVLSAVFIAITGTFLQTLPPAQTLSPARAESVTITMRWRNNDGYYPSPSDSSISCDQGNYLEIINMYGSKWLNTYVNLTLSERFLLKRSCNCKTTCQVPAFDLEEKKKIKVLLGVTDVNSWKLHIEYRCITEEATQYTQYIGCFEDDKDRDLLERMVDMSDQNTPQNCIHLCSENSYDYAGVQFSTQCFCGNRYGKYQALPQSQCSMKCAGDTNQSCGGNWANAIYVTDPDAVTPCSIIEPTITTTRSVTSQITPPTSPTTTTTTSTTSRRPTTTLTSSATSESSTTSTSTGYSTEETSKDGTGSSLASTSDVESTQAPTTYTTGHSETINSASSMLSDVSTILTTTTTMKEPKTEPYLQDNDKSTTIIAVAVSLSLLTIAVVVFLFLYRRWRRKKLNDATYKDGPHTTNRSKDDGFTNMTYSKESDHVEMQTGRLQSPDTKSTSGDSGYTDMHAEDSQEVDNDYYMIKENRESKCGDDQYYAIKDNVSSEYNRIAFKPKVIPDDANYGHTFQPGPHKLTDETYDHAEGGGTLLHAQSREDVNEYSHLNERKPKKDYGEKHYAIVNKGQSKPITKDAGGANLSEHDYFVLERKSDLSADIKDVASYNYFVLEKDEPMLADSGTKSGNDLDSRDYFVLSKEEATADANTSNSVARTENVDTHLKHEANDETQNDVKDHTYFENPLSTECEDDLHQYQAMSQRVSNTCIGVENTNHDYFVLEKELK